MLAQNFKTAADLGLTEAQHDALIKTLALMDGGKLTHVTNYDLAAELPNQIAFTAHFNMGDWSTAATCGTVCCIGGTAELVGGVSFYHAKYDNPSLHELFYPYHAEENDWMKITVEQAAVALRSYLTTGDARWDLALA